MLLKVKKQVENSILELWNEVKTAVTAVDGDVKKNAEGNASAGVRARKTLRKLKSILGQLVKVTVEAEKARKQEKSE